MVGDSYVVVHNADNDGQISIVKGLNQFLEFLDYGSVLGVACIGGGWGHEAYRHISPMLFLLGLRIEFENRLKLDRIHAKFSKIAIIRLKPL